MSKKIIFLSCILAFALISPAVFAKDQLVEFKYKKNIALSGNSKYKAIMLDEDMYGKALQNLDDLRVVDSKGEFIPYYLQDAFSYGKQSLLSYSTTMVNSFDKDNDTYLDMKVIPQKETSDILAQELILNINQNNIAKKIDVYGSYEGVDWKYIMTSNVYKVDNVARTNIRFKEVQKYKYYRFRIPNNLELMNIQDIKVSYSYYDSFTQSFIANKSMTFTSKKEGKSSVLSIDNQNLLNIKSIQLDVEGVFKRSYEVFSEKDGMQENISRGDIYNLNFKNTNLIKTDIDFGSQAVKDKNIKIKIDDYDDKALNIKGISIDYRVHKLVFEAKQDESYSVLFGNQAALMPRYDIQSYKQYVENENPDICSIGELIIQNENAKTERKGFLSASQIFNITIVIVAILMIVIVLRKLKIKS